MEILWLHLPISAKHRCIDITFFTHNCLFAIVKRIDKTIIIIIIITISLVKPNLLTNPQSTAFWEHFRA